MGKTSNRMEKSLQTAVRDNQPDHFRADPYRAGAGVAGGRPLALGLDQGKKTVTSRAIECEANANWKSGLAPVPVNRKRSDPGQPVATEGCRLTAG